MNGKDTIFVRLNEDFNHRRIASENFAGHSQQLVGCCGQIYRTGTPTHVFVVITIDKGKAKGRSVYVRLPKKAVNVISGEEYAQYISTIFPPTSFVQTHGSMRLHFGIVQKITKGGVFCTLNDVQDGESCELTRQPFGFVPISLQYYLEQTQVKRKI